jgi:hypothetical protein
LKVSELATDPSLVPSTLSGFERSMRAGFITIRLRGSQTLRGTANLSQVDDSKVASTKAQLATELQSAAARATWITQKMGEYETDGKLLPLTSLDPKLLKRYFPDKLLAGSEAAEPRKKRKDVVTTIAWWATASHPQLLSSQNQAELLKLVDRRLRVTERMLYYVAENLHGNTNLPDGSNRIFEYPDEGADPSLSAEAAAVWNGPLGTQSYLFTRKPGVTASQALTELFKPHATRPGRNRLFCDQVIQSLHLEGFMVSERNSRNGDDSWFNNLVDGKPSAAWLRIDSPWGENVDFLASAGETNYFEHKSVGIADLQLGDHLIVYNHPLFSVLLKDSEWRLENSIVVQLYPQPLVQGHGMLPMTLAHMKERLLEKCNDELSKVRARVEEDPLVRNPTENPNNPNPTIQINSRCKAVRLSQSDYAFPPVATEDCRKADWWLRWTPVEGRVGETEMFDPNTTGDSYWDGRRTHAAKHQKVEIIVENPAGNPDLHGFFFPLWEPQTEGSGPSAPPVRKQGKKSLIFPSAVDEPMASLANWYYPSDFHRGTTTVIRPKVN